MSILGTGCWLWAGATNRNGYGRVWREGRTQLVHRLVWEALHGPLPKEKPLLDHLCRQRRCFRPDHLELVSHRANTLRGQGPTARQWRRAR